MISGSRSTQKGGRPPVKGGTAKPRLKIAGRMYADTDANRKRFKLPPYGSADSPAKSPEKPVEGKTFPSGPQDTPISNEAAVRAALAAPPVAVPAASGPSQPAEIVISYAELLRTVNTYVAAYAAAYAMLPHEETAIGVALDAVIAKHWPGLRNAGPEFALTIAVAGYVTRVVIMPMLKARGLPGLADAAS